MKATTVKTPPQEVQTKEPCIVCQKPVSAFYGRWGASGTCSKKCEQIQEAKDFSKDYLTDEDATAIWEASQR